jgi:hypothetical protein
MLRAAYSAPSTFIAELERSAKIPMKLFCIFFVLIFLSQSYGEDQRHSILVQKAMGPMACGPCAFLNSLMQAGDDVSLDKLGPGTPIEKAKRFANQFGASESVVYGKNRSKYSNESGVANQDLLLMVNEFRRNCYLPLLSGEYILKSNDESSQEFARRIFGSIEASIAAGFPPLLHVRSVKANQAGKGGGDYLWYGIIGHWVCILKIEALDDHVFALKIADSWTGKVIGGLLYTQEPRNAVVPMTYEVTEEGKEFWKWEESNRCMFIAAPSLPLGTLEAEWYQRTYLAAQYIITQKDFRKVHVAKSKK